MKGGRRRRRKKSKEIYIYREKVNEKKREIKKGDIEIKIMMVAMDGGSDDDWKKGVEKREKEKKK